MKSAVLTMIVSLAAFSPYALASPEDIVGEWRGTSLCVNRQVAPACNDEQVHFIFSLRSAEPRIVHVDAQKRVGTNYETMGEMDLDYSREDHEWSYVLDTPRAKARWSFRVINDELVGTLIDQLTGLQIRKVSAARWKK